MIFGKQCPASVDTPILLYTVPAAKQAVVTLSAVNVDVGSSDASLNVYLVAGADLKVSGLILNNGGSNYTQVPPVVIAGTTDKPATAVVSGIKTSGVSINAAGTGYTVGDVLTLANSAGEPVTTVSVTSIGASGQVTGLSVLSASTGTKIHGNGRSATVTGGTGTGCTVINIRYSIVSLSITDPGNNYAAAPTVTIVPSDGNGTGAVITPTMAQADLQLTDLIEYRVVLGVGQTIERSGLVLSAGDSLFVSSSRVNAINFVAFGLTEIA